MLIADVSELGLNTPIIAEGNCQPTLRTMVCPQRERRSAHYRRGDYGDRPVEGLDDAIDLAAISPSSRSAGDALSQIRIDTLCLFWRENVCSGPSVRGKVFPGHPEGSAE